MATLDIVQRIATRDTLRARGNIAVAVAADIAVSETDPTSLDARIDTFLKKSDLQPHSEDLYYGQIAGIEGFLNSALDLRGTFFLSNDTGNGAPGAGTLITDLSTLVSGQEYTIIVGSASNSTDEEYIPVSLADLRASKVFEGLGQGRQFVINLSSPSAGGSLHSGNALVRYAKFTFTFDGNLPSGIGELEQVVRLRTITGSNYQSILLPPSDIQGLVSEQKRQDTDIATLKTQQAQVTTQIAAAVKKSELQSHEDDDYYSALNDVADWSTAGDKRGSIWISTDSGSPSTGVVTDLSTLVSGQRYMIIVGSTAYDSEGTFPPSQSMTLANLRAAKALEALSGIYDIVLSSPSTGGTSGTGNSQIYYAEFIFTFTGSLPSGIGAFQQVARLRTIAPSSLPVTLPQAAVFGLTNWTSRLRTLWNRLTGAVTSAPVAANKTRIMLEGVNLVRDPANASPSSTTVNHGLGRVPDKVDCFYDCKTADRGYSPGDRIYVKNPWDSAIWTSATQVGFRFVANQGLAHKSSGSSSGMNPSRWKVTVKPFIYV